MADYDDFNLDDFDLEDFKFEEIDTFGEVGRDDRTPVTRAKAAFKKQTRDTIKSPQFYKTLVRKALPKHYREALDLKDEIEAQGADLYNSALDRAAPAIREIKKRSKSWMPTAKRYLPKKLGDRLEKLLESDDREYTAYSEARQREDQIALMIGDVFAHQITEEAKGKEEQRNKDVFTEAVNNKRHQQSIALTEDIRRGISRLVGYQDNVAFKFQQKTLELQYRQLFATRDIVTESQRQARETNELLKDIVKNSALPDAVKLRRSEHFGAMTRERFIERTLDRLEGSTSALISRIGDNAKRMVRERVGTIADLVEQASQASELSGMTVDNAALAGQLGSELVTGTVSDRIAQPIARFLANNRFVRNTNARLGTLIANAPSMVRDYANFDPSAYDNMSGRRWWQQNDSPYEMSGNDIGRKSLWKRGVGKFHNLARGLLQDNGDDDLAIGDMSSYMRDPAVFTKRVSLSITDIIPGLLSRQLRELTRLRTGSDAPLLTYSYGRGDFVEDRAHRAELLERVERRTGKAGIGYQLDSVFDAIDPQQRLSADARQGLERQLLLNARAGRGFRVDQLADSRSYNENIKPEAIRELAAHFEALRERDKAGEYSAINATRKATESYQGLVSSIPDVLDELELQLALGNRDALEKLGLLVYSDGVSRFNYEAIISLISKEEGSRGRQSPNSPQYRYSGRSGSGGFSFATGGSRRGYAGQGSSSERVIEKIRGQISKQTTRLSQVSATGPQRLSGILSNAKALGNRTLESLSGSLDSDKLKAQSTELGNLISSGYHRVSGQARQQFMSVKRRVDEMLRNGDYRDALTGEPVRRLEDIRNNVVDASGKVVVEAQGILNGIKEAVVTNSPFVGGVTGSFTGGDTSTRHRTTSIEEPLSDRSTNASIGALVEQLIEIQATTYTDIAAIHELLASGAFGSGDGSNQPRRGFLRRPKFMDSSIMKGLKSGIGSALKGVGSFYGGVYRGFGRLASGMGGLAGGALRLTGRLLGGIGGGQGDIYIRGERFPALLGKRIKEGHYINEENGKVIKHFKDITGPVKDLEGNYVVTAEDYAKGLYDVRGESLVRGGIRWLGRFYGAMFSPLIATARLATTAVNSIRRAITAPKDIYVVGEPAPRLLAKIMEVGGYYSSRTQRPIRSIKDIDGEVVDARGNIVLSLSDIRQGLVDRFGKPITSLSERVVNLARSTIGLGVSAVKTVLKASTATLRGAWGLGRKLGSSLLRGAGRAFGMNFNSVDEAQLATSSQSVSLLEGIYNLLDDRLPKRRRVLGDTDDDGIRDNSWRDIMRKRREKAQSDKEAKSTDRDDSRSGGFLSKLGAAITGMLGGGGGSTDDGDTTIVNTGDWFGGGDKDGKDGKRPKPKGRIGQGMEKVSNFFKRIPGSSKVASALRWGFTGARGLLLGAGLAGLGGSLVTGLGSLLAGAAAVLTAPVTLTVLAVAAVAAAGYGIYRYATRDRGAEMRDIRMLQYGIDPEISDHVGRVQQLEESLNKHVVFSGGTGRIDIATSDLKEIMLAFGLREDDEETAVAWLRWFENRFKPVYLTHKAAIESLQPGGSLIDSDTTFTPLLKLSFLDKISFPAGSEMSPYREVQSPFNANATTSVSVITITEAIDNARTKFTKEAEEKKGTTDRLDTTDTKVSATQRDLAISASTAGSLNDPASSLRSQVQTRTRMMQMGGFVGGVVAVGGTTNYATSSQELTPLEMIRFKAYGLHTFDIPKVGALRELEKEVMVNITFTGDRKAQLTGSGEDYARRYSSLFGIANDNQEALLEWILWFNNRFAPVLVEYCTAARRFGDGISVNEFIRTLTAEQTLEVALAIVGAKIIKGGMSIWSVSNSPWVDYPSNTDSSSTDGNVAVLRNNIRKREIMDRVEVFTDIGPISQPKRNKATNYVQRKPTLDFSLENSLAMASVNPAKSFPDGRRSYYGMETNRLTKGSYIMPTAGRISSDYGNRTHPITGIKNDHKGIDIAAPEGTPVMAAADGVITRREYSSSYGNVIYIEHPDGNTTRYAHLSRFQAGQMVGSRVMQGDVIGYVGNTGASAGNHLHFEVRKGPTNMHPAIDPMTLIDGRIAIEAKRELEAAKAAMKEEAKSDIVDPLEGEDTIASTELNQSLKDKAPDLIEQAEGKNVTDAGNKAKQSKVTSILQPVPKALANLTGSDISKADGITDNLARSDAELAEVMAKKELRISQREQQSTYSTQVVSRSINDMTGLLERSLVVQKQMEKHLGNIHKSLEDIREISASNNRQSRSNSQTVINGRRPTEITAKQNNVDMRKTM